MNDLDIIYITIYRQDAKRYKKDAAVTSVFIDSFLLFHYQGAEINFLQYELLCTCINWGSKIIGVIPRHAQHAFPKKLLQMALSN